MTKWRSRDFHGKGAFIMKIATIGLDLAKTLFQVHGVDSQGHIVVRKQLRRADVLPFFAKLEPCVVGMEACGSSHYWGRELTKLGHTVRLIAPQFVRPYVKNNKTDAADAEAICEAVNRPNMRFVPIKTQAQQTTLSLHRARAGLVKSRTALANQIRGLLSEFGIVLPQGIRLLGQRAIEALSNREYEHCEQFRTLIQILVEHLRELGNKAAELEGRIRAMHRTDEAGHFLKQYPGSGRSPLPRWQLQSLTLRPFGTAAHSLHGGGRSLPSMPGGASRACWPSASAAIQRYERIRATDPALLFAW